MRKLMILVMLTMLPTVALASMNGDDKVEYKRKNFICQGEVSVIPADGVREKEDGAKVGKCRFDSETAKPLFEICSVETICKLKVDVFITTWGKNSRELARNRIIDVSKIKSITLLKDVSPRRRKELDHYNSCPEC